MPKAKTLQQLQQERVKNDFKFHPATEVTGPMHDAVRADLGRVASKLAKTLPPGRESSLALTKLEEAMFWANAAIARSGGVFPDDPPAETPAPSGPISTKDIKVPAPSELAVASTAAQAPDAPGRTETPVRRKPRPRAR